LVAAVPNSVLVHRHTRSVIDTHPSGERELLIQAVTQAGVLAGGAAVDVCASTLIATARIKINTVVMTRFVTVSIMNS